MVSPAKAAPAQVVFRLDASARIGSGHLMRCLALAEQLVRLGACCNFLVRPLEPGWHARIEAQGHTVLTLPPGDGAPPEPEAPAHAGWLDTSQRQDALDCQAALGARRVNWLVLDHYALDARWEHAMRASAERIMVIDDLADRPHAADLLLDQNLHTGADERYAALLPARSTCLLGPRFALLRPEFRDGPRHRQADRMARVLVCFGGAAPIDANRRMLAALAGCGALEVTLIAAQAQHDVLRAAAPANVRLALLTHSERMAELMREHDLALGAGGGMLWERFSQGVPSVVFGIAENQAPGVRSALEAGLVSGHPALEALDDAALQALLRAALLGSDMLHGQARRAQALVDGRGCERVARRLLAPEMTFEPAQLGDARRLYEWRNHPAVRAHAHDSRPIDFETHRTWLATVLADPQRALLIAHAGGAPVGVLRFDLCGEEALVSVYLVPERLGQGLGPAIIEQGSLWLQASRPAVKRIRAEVHAANPASLASFEAAGFRPFAHTLIRNLEAP
jgi:UDP-2,4-diacetamido-2,4,6-trideoxy-beta-L-altropyranose hydrolase